MPTKEIPDDVMEQIRTYAANHSAAPDKETPDWIITDVSFGYNLRDKEVQELNRRYKHMADWGERLQSELISANNRIKELEEGLNEWLRLHDLEKEHMRRISKPELEKKTEQLLNKQ